MTSSQRSHPRRVVVTGIGVISPAGCTLESYWQGLTSGRSAVRKIERFDTAEMPVHGGGEIPRADLIALAGENALNRNDLTTLLASLATKQALADAGLDAEARANRRIGLILGSGLGPCHTLAESYGAYDSKGWQGLRPTTVPRSMYNVVASNVSMEYHLTGTHCVLAAACASAGLAMTQAYEAVLSGREKMVLTGGADSPLTPSMFGAWINLRVLSKNPDPAKASRPFDKKRDGMVLSEGAAVLMFEEERHARERGAHIYAEMIGAGASSDASHITKPEVAGQAAALTQALEVAGIGPAEVDYINAHGTSTVLNDLTETQAIKQVFGAHAREVPISSTKSVLGHSMGASGALELAACILAIRYQLLPPTVNLDEPDPECDLDYVPNVARPAHVRTALSNSFAFGGANSVLAVRAYEG